MSSYLQKWQDSAIHQRARRERRNADLKMRLFAQWSRVRRERALRLRGLCEFLTKRELTKLEKGMEAWICAIFGESLLTPDLFLGLHARCLT